MNDREKIIKRLQAISDEMSGERLLSLTKQQYQDLEAEEEALLLEYVENLEYIPVSRCPICKKVLSVTVDKEGLDGPWWWKICPVDLPRHDACEHFVTFLGAMDLQGRMPTEADEEVYLGPSIPFVIARLLEMEGMVAVLSSLDDAKGDTIYLIAYFSDKEVPQSQRHQEWRKEGYPLYDEDGNYVVSESKFDPWDFDLEPWLKKGKLIWIAPYDDGLQLREGLPCPYTGLEGIKMNQVAAAGQIRLLSAPQGEENAMYERD